MKIIFSLSIIVFMSFSCQKIQRIEKIENLTILHLTGSPYERGLAHGQLLNQEISDIIIRWKKEVELNFNEDFDEVIDHFFTNTTYIDVIKNYCPDLLEEVYGISKGCGINYETILAFQLSEEIDWFSNEMKRKNCTSVSVNRKKDKPTILAQNMDPPSFLHGHPTLLHIIDEQNKQESYVYTFPGFIGLNGLNSNGVAITCNSISMLNYSKYGLPVSFIVRSILKLSHEQLAFDFLHEVPIGIPQCFTVGGVSKAICFECSKNSIREFYPFEDKSITLHTNFAAANRDFNQEFIQLLSEYGKTVDDPYYCPRYFLAFDKIKEVNYNINYLNIKAILSLTEPKIQPISNEETYGCLIMELTENPILHIAPGKPDITDFITLRFNQQ